MLMKHPHIAKFFKIIHSRDISTLNFFSSSFSIFYVEALDVFHVASSLNGILESIYLFKTLKSTFLKRKNK